MPTIPTQRMETELRKLYLRWISGVDVDSTNVAGKIDDFRRQSESIISRLGGQTARLGALGDFPAPKFLELSPYAGKIYDAMQQAAIQAGIMTGLGSKETARTMFNAGMGKSYRQLERLARTETTNAYWKNAFDSTADLPGIVMVWGAEESKRTCEWCLSRDGLVIADGSVRDHPNGRCTPIPTLRSRVAYKGTLQPDGSVTMDEEWTGRKTTVTKVAAGLTTKAQRDPLNSKQNPAKPSVAAPLPGKSLKPTITQDDKIRNAETMFGTGSKQHKAAQARFSAQPRVQEPAPAKPSSTPVRPVDTRVDLERASQAKPVGSDFRTMSNAEKIEATWIMYGAQSPQYKQALKRWG